MNSYNNINNIFIFIYINNDINIDININININIIFVFVFLVKFWRCYFVILYAVVVSASPLSGSLPFPQFPVQSLIFTPKSLLFMPKSRATLVFTCSTAHGA